MKFIEDIIEGAEKRTENKNLDKTSTKQDDTVIPPDPYYGPKIFVVGVGGAGNNTISRLNETELNGIHTIAINTDAQDLYHIKSDEKILIGKKTCKGHGAGGIPKVGEKCVEESEDEIKEKLEGADMVFVICGLGGGTGTGAGPLISKIAKDSGALTVAIATTPFSSEGIRRRKNAEKGLEKLQENADTTIVVPNDKLLEIAPNSPINKAFSIIDEILCHAVKGITELITKPGLVSLDFVDIKRVIEGSGRGMIGMGESGSEDITLESVHKALNSPLFDLDISEVKGAIVNITGSSDMTLYKAEKIVQVVASKLTKAEIIWGVKNDDYLQNTIRTTIIFLGLNPNSTYKPEYFDNEYKGNFDRDGDDFELSWGLAVS